jgi:anti-anti-sigma regulatory factor
VASQLVAQPDPMSDLHLDFTELTFLDSAALSGLLLLHRRTSEAGDPGLLGHASSSESGAR